MYVLDTGIRASHAQFGGRVDAAAGATFVNDGRGTTDCNGHGTHVAGIIGGATYGVAKAAKLVPVRTLNCSGSASTSTVIAAVDWVATEHDQAGRRQHEPRWLQQHCPGPGGAERHHQRRPFSIAAGNGNFLGFAANACNTSPARVRTHGAMTIGASDINDNKASFSNYGDCVDWFAPGVNIVSSWYSSDTATRSLSGTSMAAPYTAGVAALYLDAHPDASPADDRKWPPDPQPAVGLRRQLQDGPLHSHIVFTGRGGTGEVL